jgi:hypothetical protein
MKRILYKTLLILGITIVSCVVLIVLLFTWKMPFNDFYLKVFEYNFRKSISVLHPKQSTFVAEVAEVGNWADGTYCEFIAGQFRSSTLSEEELEKIYPNDFFTAGVNFFDENEDLGSPWSEWKEKYLKDYEPKEGENVYLVWKADYDNSSDGDIRCD